MTTFGERLDELQKKRAAEHRARVEAFLKRQPAKPPEPPYLGGCATFEADYPELAKLAGRGECCSSCHAEWDEGFYAPSEIDTPRGWYGVCCRFSGIEVPRGET